MGPLSAQPETPSAVETVAGDLICLYCGYNLNTLRLDGRCPECGHAVQDSYDSAQRLDWLHPINNGLRTLVIGWWGVVLVSVVRMLHALAWVGVLGTGLFSAFLIRVPAMLTALVALWICVGMFQVTRWSTNAPLQIASVSRRRLLRVVAIASVVAEVFIVYGLAIFGFNSVFHVMVFLVFVIAHAVSLLLLNAHLIAIVRRWPNTLGQLARVWCILVCANAGFRATLQFIVSIWYYPAILNSATHIFGMRMDAFQSLLSGASLLAAVIHISECLVGLQFLRRCRVLISKKLNNARIMRYMSVG